MTDIQEIEVSIETAKRIVKEADMIDQLYKSKAFKTIIIDGYFKDFAAIIVQRKSAPGYQDATAQIDIENTLIGIGQLQQFIFNKRMQGEAMRGNIEALEVVREEILDEAGAE